MIFLFGGLMVTAFVVFLSRPLWQRSAEATARGTRSVAFYQDQLREVARDVDRGVLEPSEAEAATREIERRLLKAARDAETSIAEPVVYRPGRLVVIGLLGLSPLGAALLYFQLGTPTLTNRTQAEMAAAEARELSLARNIAALEEALAATPESLDVLVPLARAYTAAGNIEAAFETYDRAIRLTGGRSPQLAAEYAVLLVSASGGVVTDDAVEIFSWVADNAPGDPQATFYLALGTAQRGDMEAAAEDLRALEERAPADAPWLSQVTALLGSLEDGSFTTPPAAALGASDTAPPPGASQEEMAMIRSMVDGLAARLAESPDDLEGWRRLARSYAVLGETEAAAAAFREVLARAPDDPDATAFIARMEEKN